MHPRTTLLALALLLTGFIAGNLAPVSAQRDAWQQSDVRHAVTSLQGVERSLKRIDRTLREIARKK